MRITTFKHSSPSRDYPLETAYALIREAEAQPTTEAGRFRAMDCHADLLDLHVDDRGVQEMWMGEGGFFPRILANQERLGITKLSGKVYDPDIDEPNWLHDNR